MPRRSSHARLTALFGNPYCAHLPGAEGQQILGGELVEVAPGVQHDLRQDRERSRASTPANAELGRGHLGAREQVGARDQPELPEQAVRAEGDEEVVAGDHHPGQQQMRQAADQLITALVVSAGIVGDQWIHPSHPGVGARRQPPVLPALAGMLE